MTETNDITGYKQAKIKAEVNGKLVTIDVLMKDSGDDKDSYEIYIDQRSFHKLGIEYDYDDEGVVIIDGDKYIESEMISTVGKNVMQITDKHFKHALTPLPNQHAYIQQIDKNFFEQLEFDPDNGIMWMKNNFLEPVTLQSLITRSNIKELDMSFLRSLYTVIFHQYSKTGISAITVYLPALAKHLGINVRGEGDRAKANDLMRKIRDFHNVIGVFKSGSFYPLLLFKGYNRQNNTITFESPYMIVILRELLAANTVVKKSRTPYIAPHHNFLMHGTLANERNKAAVEIVSVITTLLLQRGEAAKPKNTLSAKEIEAAAYRGAKQANRDEFSAENKNTSSNKNNNKKDDKAKEAPHITKAHKSYRGIIEEIPLIMETLDEAKDHRHKNKILNRAFTGVIELLRTKTNVYKYFKNLTISPTKEITVINKKKIEGKMTEIISKEIVIIAPTVSTLDNVLIFAHEGKNPDY